MEISRIKPNVSKAVFLANNYLVELVCHAVNLEGIMYSLAEVRSI